MNKYLLDPNVCTSSLNEKGEPVDPNETAHKWDYDEDTENILCVECGAEKTNE